MQGSWSIIGALHRFTVPLPCLPSRAVFRSVVTSLPRLCHCLAPVGCLRHTCAPPLPGDLPSLVFISALHFRSILFVFPSPGVETARVYRNTFHLEIICPFLVPSFKLQKSCLLVFLLWLSFHPFLFLLLKTERPVQIQAVPLTGNMTIEKLPNVPGLYFLYLRDGKGHAAHIYFSLAGML